ncbi:Membrane bound FAD containing D-sorbitol dehydrogenase [Filimonas lacunae]|uniref:Membrane bound FAD containing D-sorbitol dehydrogenase n=1 Tax=Filimonas lacunae TaxID=477680 RepID=A0A173ME62_9BACT|nr:sugar dehydrogenase complex small subunit [Filimonas lacunae]BAV05883.1 hypothetical protein FLA_1895 [Filimonas lacunae]SIT34571.1 Membrane bound FAD containing D-sorbitol dehydrogenase [Filimonas lacunae]
MNMTFDQFIGLSAALTGYSASDLHPSRDTQKVGDALYAELSLASNEIPVAQLDALTAAWNKIADTPASDMEAAVQKDIINNLTITRLAQNIIYMWFLGIWYDLRKNPAVYFTDGTVSKDHVISALAYTNGLVWGEMGAHPMGFSNGTYGYWSQKPTLPKIG